MAGEWLPHVGIGQEELLWRLFERMSKYRQRFKCGDRFLCALLALVFFVCAVVPAASAAEPIAETPTETLTAAEAEQMGEVDDAVTALTQSESYTEMTFDEREAAAVAQLTELAEQGLVDASSIYVDVENGMVSYTYTCGAFGGILLNDLEDDNGWKGTVSDLEDAVMRPNAHSEANASNAQSGHIGSAAIYYAFDNTVNSSRYPYYSYMKGFWTALGLDTNLDTSVTVADLRGMGNYDLCVLSAHGAYYTYTYGWLWKRAKTEAVILLTEESSFAKDMRYAIDLLYHRVIKINGLYSVTPDFFNSGSFFRELDGTIIYSEACEFLGSSDCVDGSMADAMLAGGASAVIGYVNNVYTVYSRSMLWDTVNHLLAGETVGEALDHAKENYGSDDVVWYLSQGGRRPHKWTSRALLYGDVNARLVDAAAAETARAA